MIVTLLLAFCLSPGWGAASTDFFNDSTGVCSFVPLDVVFVLDSSGSLKNEDFKTEIEFVKRFVTNSKIGPKDVQISLFTFADKSNYQIKLNDFNNKNELLQKLKNIQRDDGMTNTDVVLTDVKNQAFLPVNGGRGPNAKQVVIILTDGEPVQPEATKAAAVALRSLNVEIYAVGIGKKVNLARLYNIAGKSNVGTVTDSKSLEMNVEKIMKKVCVSDKTQECKSPSDVIFVLDSSDSVTEDELHSDAEFITNFVKYAKIGPQMTRIGVVLYADDSSFAIRLNEIYDKAKLIERIKGMKRLTGVTYTDKALKYVRKHGFSPENGGRGDKANKVAIILTDGESVLPAATKIAAKDLQAANVEIYAIGIGHKTKLAELRAISTDKDHFYTVANHNNLHSIEEKLFGKLCRIQSAFE